MVGCADLDEPFEPRAEPEAATPDQAVADLQLAPAEHDDCSSFPHTARLAIEGPLVDGSDLLLRPGDAGLRLTVRNLAGEPLVIEPRLTWRFSGGVQREPTARFELAADATHELVIDLDRRLDTRAYPASLDVQLRSWHGRARGNDAFFPTVYFHADPSSGELHVYDDAGLVARHRAGDLLGTHRAVDERDDVAGVGIAHLARLEDLSGDPADVRRNHTEGEVR